MPPDRSKFNEYYHYDLGTAMRQETLLFTRHLIDNNLSVANFLDSDFTFVSKRLAVVDPTRKASGLHPQDARDNPSGPDCQPSGG